MRVLIVGAGIAGLTLSALLSQRGIRPQLVDRAPDFNAAGYMLALFPMGNRVLHGLRAFDSFLATSEPMDIYTMCNGHGEPMQTFDIGGALAKFGVTRQLQEENTSLRQRQDSLMAQRATLLHKNEQGGGRVGAVVGRLKGMEQVS